MNTKILFIALFSLLAPALFAEEYISFSDTQKTSFGKYTVSLRYYYPKSFKEIETAKNLFSRDMQNLLVDAEKNQEKQFGADSYATYITTIFDSEAEVKYYVLLLYCEEGSEAFGSVTVTEFSDRPPKTMHDSGQQSDFNSLLSEYEQWCEKCLGML